MINIYPEEIVDLGHLLNPDSCFATQLREKHPDYIEDILIEIMLLTEAEKADELRGTIFE